MDDNLLDQLAATEVPPMPEGFESRIHEGVNRSLLMSHLVELGLYALPHCIGEFGKAMSGAIIYSLEKPAARRRGR